MKCGLLGRKLGHSYSPQIHRFLGSYGYELFEKEPEQVAQFLKTGDFTGLNVTIPYKTTVMPLCDSLSDTAQRIGAVNTIIRKDGKLIGHNTDHFGFSSMVNRSGLQLQGKKVLVLGSGGASVTAQTVLKEFGAEVIVISRSGENNYHNISNHADAACIVNCTPVGMYPDNGVSPVDLALFDKLEGVLDMIYNPAKTKLLLDAEARGLSAHNGLWMLVAQAKESAEWFLGEKLPDSLIETIHNKLKNQMQNIILIGMPGCGKSTLAAILGEKTGREVVDTDDGIVAQAGCPIPEIFQKDGEEVFRQIETKVLEDCCKLSGKIIATGGGCVTRTKNKELLWQNGTVFWLQRALEDLPIAGRPLSQATTAQQMYQIREPMYRSFSHHIVDNSGSLEATAEQILAYFA